jgi:activator of 2-hydroxyglutaryl-CoA dehydratase
MAGMEDIVQEVGPEPVLSAGLTGSGGGPVATYLGVSHINELVAQVAAVGRYYPHTRTIIEIGGQDSKYMSVAWDEPSGKLVLADFAMNSL